MARECDANGLIQSAAGLNCTVSLYVQATASRAARKLLHKQSDDLDTQCRDQLRVLPLGASPSPRAAGTGQVFGRRVAAVGKSPVHHFAKAHFAPTPLRAFASIAKTRRASPRVTTEHNCALESASAIRPAPSS